LVSSDAGFGSGAAGARRGALGAGAAGRDAIPRTRLGAARRGAARRTLRLAIRFALRFVDRFAVFFFDAFLLDGLRDFAAVFAVFRRFLAMRAPPDEWRVFYLISSSSAC
jgi:hypothetical protein